jgi:hypothetical protein
MPAYEGPTGLTALDRRSRAGKAGFRPGLGVLRGLTFALAQGRRMAALTAACVLAAQLVAAAHVHPWAYVDAYCRAAHPSVSEAACPVCVLHAHAPACASGLPALIQPVAAEPFFAYAALLTPLCAPATQLFGRAPPKPV